MRAELKTLSYIVGVSIGDGNLSNPNKRAVRLRITCDTKYKKLIQKIQISIKKLLPNNKVSSVNRAKTYIDISCYSNKWEKWLGWKVGNGSKYNQNVSVPKWIKENKDYTTRCLKGLFETDGSVYYDRGYKMINFVTIIPALAEDVNKMILNLGYKVKMYKICSNKKPRYNIRLSNRVDEFIKLIDFFKE